MDHDVDFMECDGNHLGLWPDKFNAQNYYKCEIDPRNQISENCLQDYLNLEKLNMATTWKTTVTPPPPLEMKIDGGPTSKPCFLLTQMKCSNGFKYSHKWRICIPDIVYGTILNLD